MSTGLALVWIFFLVYACFWTRNLGRKKWARSGEGKMKEKRFDKCSSKISTDTCNQLDRAVVFFEILTKEDLFSFSEEELRGIYQRTAFGKRKNKQVLLEVLLEKTNSPKVCGWVLGKFSRDVWESKEGDGELGKFFEKVQKKKFVFGQWCDCLTVALAIDKNFQVRGIFGKIMLEIRSISPSELEFLEIFFYCLPDKHPKSWLIIERIIELTDSVEQLQVLLQYPCANEQCRKVIRGGYRKMLKLIESETRKKKKFYDLIFVACQCPFQRERFMAILEIENMHLSLEGVRALFAEAQENKNADLELVAREKIWMILEKKMRRPDVALTKKIQLLHEFRDQFLSCYVEFQRCSHPRKEERDDLIEAYLFSLEIGERAIAGNVFELIERIEGDFSFWFALSKRVTQNKKISPVDLGKLTTLIWFQCQATATKLHDQILILEQVGEDQKYCEKLFEAIISQDFSLEELVDAFLLLEKRYRKLNSWELRLFNEIRRKIQKISEDEEE